jgi:hypothetical protein
MSVLSYEMDGVDYDFEDGEDIRMALSGEWGEDWKAVAEYAMADLRTELDGGNEAEEAELDATELALERQEVARELSRLEKHLGRELTPAQTKEALDHLNMAGDIPDLVERYGDKFDAKQETTEGRRERMLANVEAATAAEETPSFADIAAGEKR